MIESENDPPSGTLPKLGVSVGPLTITGLRFCRMTLSMQPLETALDIAGSGSAFLVATKREERLDNNRAGGVGGAGIQAIHEQARFNAGTEITSAQFQVGPGIQSHPHSGADYGSAGMVDVPDAADFGDGKTAAAGVIAANAYREAEAAAPQGGGKTSRERLNLLKSIPR